MVMKAWGSLATSGSVALPTLARTQAVYLAGAELNVSRVDAAEGQGAQCQVALPVP